VEGADVDAVKQTSNAGGCACGAVRYHVLGEPDVALVCHCTFCQRRLATAFAVIAYFNDSAVVFDKGQLTEYEHRSDHSGRWLRMAFCSRCGTTVSHAAEVRPGMRAIAVGSFDDPNWMHIQRHVWVRSKHPWVGIPPEVPAFEKGSQGAQTTQPSQRQP
jgi:hypothetical protein